MNFESIVEFARENKTQIIDSMRTKHATQFMALINNPDFNESKELIELKIEERALSRTEELIEIVLETMTKGERIV